jgi:hypothetical protein
MKRVLHTFSLLLVTLCCLVLFLPGSLLADSTVSMLPESRGPDLSLLDAANQKSMYSDAVEDVDGGKTIYVKRPYGYLQSTKESSANLSIVKTSIQHYSESRSTIKGEIKNLDDKVIDIIVLTFNLYNADGAQIGNAYATVDYLSPKATWKFETDPIERSDLQFEKYGSIYIGIFD